MFRYRQAGLYPNPGAALVLLVILGLGGCAPRSGVEPPVNAPLSRGVIGYGVINSSYSRLMNEPDHNGIALGLVREKTVVHVLERRVIKKDEVPEYWVFIDGNYRGWLPESVVTLYDNEGKAQTAASREP